jgi:hypothetical protein
MGRICGIYRSQNDNHVKLRLYFGIVFCQYSILICLQKKLHTPRV